jgi:hypothetical protein
MNTQTPRDLQEHLSRAVLACKRAQWALIDLGAIAAPEGGTEIHNWQCLNSNLQNAMRLLLGFGLGTECHVNARYFVDDGIDRESIRGQAPHSLDDPGLEEVISELADQLEM